MSIKVDLDEVDVRKLTLEDDTASFSCGQVDLDDYIWYQALGCQFVILNAKKASINFYESCGFTLGKHQPTNREEPFMYFKLPTS